jgi:hypothetical protein
LEELDCINWGRFMRAIGAERIETIENRRRLYLAKKVKDLTPDEWAAIGQHDKWCDDGE